MKGSPLEELLTHCVINDLSTPLLRGTAQPQRAPPPRQREFTPAGAAEFVICDHTIRPVLRTRKAVDSICINRILQTRTVWAVY
jgi:hypothetical protein